MTKADYRRRLVRIAERFGNAPIHIMADFRIRKDILAWLDKWASQPRSVDWAVGTLSTVLSWAAERGMLASNIATGISTLHRVNHADEIWEDHHWEQVKDIPSQVKDVLQLARMTGLRMGGLLALDWSNVRPDGFDCRFHDLRGTCATWLTMRGLTDNEIGSVLGWKAGRVSEIRARYVDGARIVVSIAERLNR